MSAVLSVARIVPQPIQAVQVALGPNGKTAGLIAALLAELTAIAGYKTENNTGPEFFGGWRIKLLRGSDPELVAYPNDYILVTDASYQEPEGWSVQSTSRAHVYGQSQGMAGTAANFVAMFTAAPTDDAPFNWPATRTPPQLVAQSGLSAALWFSQPVSANGPYDYTVNLTDSTDGSTAQVTPDWQTAHDTGVVSANLPGLVDGHDYSATVDITATRYGLKETSLPSNTITAAVEVAQLEPAPPQAGPRALRHHVAPQTEPLSPGLVPAPAITRVNN